MANACFDDCVQLYPILFRGQLHFWAHPGLRGENTGKDIGHARAFDFPFCDGKMLPAQLGKSVSWWARIN